MDRMEKIEIAVAMAERHPGEFEPHQHQAIREMEREKERERVFKGAWDIAEGLWFHERSGVSDDRLNSRKSCPPLLNLNGPVTIDIQFLTGPELGDGPDDVDFFASPDSPLFQPK